MVDQMFVVVVVAVVVVVVVVFARHLFEETLD